MPPKARQIRMDSRTAQAEMAALEQRSDDELAREQKYRSAAQAILGARAAERYDAAAAREHFRRSIAAARPQERMQIRRMADASIALAERRPDALKEAVSRLGQAPPSDRQLLEFLTADCGQGQPELCGTGFKALASVCTLRKPRVERSLTCAESLR